MAPWFCCNTRRRTLRSGVPSPGVWLPSQLWRLFGLGGGSGGRRTLPPWLALGREPPLPSPGELVPVGEGHVSDSLGAQAPMQTTLDTVMECGAQIH